MVHVLSLNVTWQPAWVSGVTPIKFVCSSGNMWTLFAPCGIPGIGRSAVCVDVITCSFATRTVIGAVVGSMFWRLELAEK
jgi:hypothetical protein